MASPVVVRKCLGLLASNYGKSDQWAEDQHKLWTRGLSSLSDRDVIRGTETWCNTKRVPPNLARLRELIDADPSTAKAPALDGCPACDMTGWRELARHYVKDGRDQVRAGLAPCDCRKGRNLARGDDSKLWSSIVDHWHRLPNTTAVFHSTAEHRHLTTDERHTKEQIERMRQAAERAEANKHKFGSRNDQTWQPVVKR